MKGMFSNCTSLKQLDLSNFNTANVTSFASMFKGCSEIENINISGFNALKASDMSDMFKYCSKLTSVNLSNVITGEGEAETSVGVKYFNCMFMDCSSLTNLDLSSFSLAKAYSISRMFKGCTSLETLNISSDSFWLWDTIENENNWKEDTTGEMLEGVPDTAKIIIHENLWDSSYGYLTKNYPGRFTYEKFIPSTSTT